MQIHSSQSKPITWTRPITDVGIAKLRQSLLEVDWSIFYRPLLDVNAASSVIVGTLSQLINEHLPLKKCKNDQSQIAPWFSKELRQFRDTLSAVKIVSEVTKDPVDINTLRRLKTDHNKLINETKKKAYDSYIERASSVSKGAWRLINHERNKKQHITGSAISSEKFNLHFTSLPESVVKNLPPVAGTPGEYMSSRPSPAGSFFLVPTTIDELISTANSLKNTNSFDVYNLNTKIVKKTIDIYAKPLCKLINACFSQGVFPDAMKKSRVVPIFKNGDPQNVNNYRPISIIPILGKLIEILVKVRLSNFLSKNKTLNNLQFGFTSGKSTIDAVLTVIEGIVEGFEENMHTSLVCFDLSKAFDCVDHGNLLEKLAHYGIRGTAWSFFESYLGNRQQKVVVANEESLYRNVKYGVPQGSVLGPLLFLLMINDLDDAILFADDTTSIVSDKDPVRLKELINERKQNIETWFNTNGLCLNKNKTQELFLSTNPTLLNGKNIKLLGITIDDGLNWQAHINQVSSKLASTIFLLRKLRPLLSFSLLLSAYHALFQSRLMYGILIWGSSSYAIKIFQLQKRAVRILANASLRDHCKPLFLKYGILTFPCLYIISMLIEIHKKQKTMVKNSDVHSYNTRQAQHIKTAKYKFTKSIKNSLDISMYNNLPESYKNLPLTTFKHKITKHCKMHNFYSVDEYKQNTPYTFIKYVSILNSYMWRFC